MKRKKKKYYHQKYLTDLQTWLRGQAEGLQEARKRAKPLPYWSQKQWQVTHAAWTLGRETWIGYTVGGKRIAAVAVLLDPHDLQHRQVLPE